MGAEFWVHDTLFHASPVLVSITTYSFALANPQKRLGMITRGEKLTLLTGNLSMLTTCRSSGGVLAEKDCNDYVPKATALCAVKNEDTRQLAFNCATSRAFFGLWTLDSGLWTSSQFPSGFRSDVAGLGGTEKVSAESGCAGSNTGTSPARYFARAGASLRMPSTTHRASS